MIFCYDTSKKEAKEASRTESVGNEYRRYSQIPTRTAPKVVLGSQIYPNRRTLGGCASPYSPVHARPFLGASQCRSWSHYGVLGAILCAFIAKIDKVSEDLTLRYPHEEPCVGGCS